MAPPRLFRKGRLGVRPKKRYTGAAEPTPALLSLAALDKCVSLDSSGRLLSVRSVGKLMLNCEVGSTLVATEKRRTAC